MTGSEEDTAVRFVLADDVGCCWSGEDTVTADDELGDAIGSTDLKDDLYGIGREVSSVATKDNSLSRRVDRVEDRLDEVLCVMLSSCETME